MHNFNGHIKAHMQTLQAFAKTHMSRVRCLWMCPHPVASWLANGKIILCQLNCAECLTNRINVSFTLTCWLSLDCNTVCIRITFAAFTRNHNRENWSDSKDIPRIVVERTVVFLFFFQYILKNLKYSTQNKDATCVLYEKERKCWNKWWLGVDCRVVCLSAV